MKKIIDVTEKDLAEITKIIKTTHLSYYNLLEKDFVCIRDKGKIIAFGRIYKTGENFREVGSLWVDEKYRGKKIGQIVMNLLILHKKKDIPLYLATEKDLEKYYKSVGFQVVEKYPDRFIDALEYAKSIGLKGIVMKYI